MRKFEIVVLAVLVTGILGLATEPGKLIIWADDTRTPIFRELGEAYSKATGIPVEVVEMPMEEIREQCIIAAPVGKGPDMIVGAHDWVGKLVLNGTITSLDLPKEVLAQFDPVAIEAMSFGGKLYGIPYAREGVALLYNKKLVPEPPTTWEELLQIARELTDPTLPQYGFVVESPFPYNYSGILFALGGYVFGKNPDGSLNRCDIGLDNMGAILGAEVIDQLVEEGLMPAEVPWETMTGLLSEGRVGMVITGPWSIPIAKGGGVDVGVAPIPSIPVPEEHTRAIFELFWGPYPPIPDPVNPWHFVPKPWVGVPGVMVNAFSPNMVIIQDFLLNHFITKDAMLTVFRRDPRPPAYLPAYEDVKGDPILDAFAESISNGIPLPNIPEMSAVWLIWGDAMTLILNQKAEPDVALHEAADKIRDTLGCK
jgi:maltose-binding protein MalE